MICQVAVLIRSIQFDRKMVAYLADYFFNSFFHILVLEQLGQRFQSFFTGLRLEIRISGGQLDLSRIMVAWKVDCKIVRGEVRIVDNNSSIFTDLSLDPWPVPEVSCWPRVSIEVSAGKIDGLLKSSSNQVLKIRKMLQ